MLENSPIMLGIIADAFKHLLCSKLCWQTGMHITGLTLEHFEDVSEYYIDCGSLLSRKCAYNCHPPDHPFGLGLKIQSPQYSQMTDKTATWTYLVTSCRGVLSRNLITVDAIKLICVNDFLRVMQD